MKVMRLRSAPNTKIAVRKKPAWTKWPAAKPSPTARRLRSSAVRQPPGHSCASDEALQAVMNHTKAEREVMRVPAPTPSASQPPCNAALASPIARHPAAASATITGVFIMTSPSPPQYAQDEAREEHR